MRWAGIRILLAVACLGGCGLFSDDENGVPADERQDVLSDRGVPVESVHSIEVGRTRDGFAVTAFGTAPALGYGEPHLRARRDGQVGADGFLDFDFVATPPALGLERGQGAITARRIRGDTILGAEALIGASGIRVHALSGGVQLRF